MFFKITFLINIAWMTSQCASTSDKGSNESRSSAGRATGGGAPQESEVFNMSRSFRPLHHSIGNDNFGFDPLDPKKALSMRQQASEKLKKSKDIRDKISLLTLIRLSSADIGSMFQASKDIMEDELKADRNRNIPEFVQLELALAAVQTRKYSLAEFYLRDLVRSNRPRVKAHALNATGLIALKEDRVPEAVVAFEEAIKMDPEGAAARLNLGFVATRFGDFPNAAKLLSGLNRRWFGKYALATVERFGSNPRAAGRFCEELVKEKSSHAPILFNCALYYHQVEKKDPEALLLLERFIGLARSQRWEREADQVRTQIMAKKDTPKPSATPSPGEQPKAD